MPRETDAYAAVDDVVVLLPHLTPLNTTSRPSEAGVAAMLDDASNQLDQALSERNITTPVTAGPAALNILATWAAIGGAAKAAFAQMQGQDSKHLQYRDDWNAILAAIAEEDFILPGLEDEEGEDQSQFGRLRHGFPEAPYFERDTALTPSTED